MKIIVVGAGIGGMSLGIALRRRGFDVLVLESRKNFAEEGAGVVLGPNVMAAVKLLGLNEAIERLSRPVEAMNITTANGRVLARSAYRAKELPLPGMAIHRSRLHEVLRAAFDGELRTGAHVEHLDLNGRPALTIRGERLTADLVVGADGIRSMVRDQLNPGFSIRYSGVTCFRFVVDGQWTTEVFEMWGRGKRVGVVPIGQERTYVFLTLNAPRRAPAPFLDLAGFRATWSEFGGPAPEALARVKDLHSLLHNDLEDGIAERWSAPGCVLLGDAAHAVTPNMGQGAGLAVEDSCCLAALLADRTRPLEAALSEYEALRRPRATWIRDQSFGLGRIAQLESPFLRFLRDLALRLTPNSVNEATLRRIVTDMPGVPIR